MTLVLSRLYVLLLVTVSFMIFNAETLGGAASDIGGLFGAGGIPLVSAEALYQAGSFLTVLLTAAVGATPAVRNILNLAAQKTAGRTILKAAEPVALIGLMVVMTAYLADGSFNPFLYFRF